MTFEELCIKCLRWTAIVIGLFFAFALVPPILVLALSLVPLLAIIGLVLSLFGRADSVSKFFASIRCRLKSKQLWQ